MSRYPWRDTSEDIAKQSGSQWETPAGAQDKADKALEDSKEYTDEQNQNFNEHIQNTVIHVTQNDKDRWNNHIEDNVKHLTSAEHTKLTGIQEGAEVNQNSFSIIKSPGRNDVSAKSKQDSLNLVGGTGITITTNENTNTVNFFASGEVIPGPHGETHNITGGSDPIPDLVQLREDFDALTPVSIGAETPQGAQDKADAAKTEAKQEAKTNLDTHLLDYVRQPAFAVTTGTGSAYTVTLDPVPINLVDGFGITIVPHVVNVANPTLNINGLGAIALKDQTGVAYTADKLQVGKPYTFRYVGTDFLADSGSNNEGAAVSILDWSAYTTHCKWDNTDVNVPATTWSTFLSVTGTGVLNFVRSFFVDFVSNTPDMRIIVDGTTYNIAGSTLSGARASWGAAFVAPISFGTSLVIQLYNNQSTARKLCLHYTYLLQSGDPSEEQTVLTASQRRLAVAEITTASWTTVVNITGTGYLLGIEFEGSSVPSSGNFSINATVQIDNVNIKGNEGVFGSGAIARHIVFNGPIRFNTRLSVQNYNTAPTSGTGITKVYYILD